MVVCCSSYGHPPVYVEERTKQRGVVQHSSGTVTRTDATRSGMKQKEFKEQPWHEELKISLSVFYE